MKREEMVCANCLCRQDAAPGDMVKDICTVGPVWRPITPGHHCGSGKWRGIKTVKTEIPGIVTDTSVIFFWGEWEGAQ